MNVLLHLSNLLLPPSTLHSTSDDYRPTVRPRRTAARIKTKLIVKAFWDSPVQQNDWLVSLYCLHLEARTADIIIIIWGGRDHVLAGIGLEAWSQSHPIINDCSVNYPINNNNIITLFWFKNWIPLICRHSFPANHRLTERTSSSSSVAAPRPGRHPWYDQAWMEVNQDKFCNNDSPHFAFI